MLSPTLQRPLKSTRKHGLPSAPSTASLRSSIATGQQLLDLAQSARTAASSDASIIAALTGYSLIRCGQICVCFPMKMSFACREGALSWNARGLLQERLGRAEEACKDFTAAVALVGVTQFPRQYMLAAAAPGEDTIRLLQEQKKNVCANTLEVLRTARRYSLREATVLHCWLQLPAMVKMACASPAPLSCHKRPNNHRSILFDQAV
jgi:hypothetical protein